MKYYRLCPQYQLRGWNSLPYALVHDGEVIRLSGDKFNALLICDGMTNIGAIRSAKILDILRSFELKGYICASASPKKMNREQYYHHYDNCYIREANWSAGDCIGEMTYEEVSSMIEQMTKCGIYHLVISGGDLFDREDFWAVVDYALENGIGIDRIHTNGRKINDFTLDKFEERGIKPEFSISFDGVDWRQWMMGLGGAEQAGLNALRYCYLRGFPTSVEMSVHQENENPAIIREVIDALVDSGVGTIRFRDGSGVDEWRDVIDEDARVVCDMAADAG